MYRVWIQNGRNVIVRYGYVYDGNFSFPCPPCRLHYFGTCSTSECHTHWVDSLLPVHYMIAYTHKRERCNEQPESTIEQSAEQGWEEGGLYSALEALKGRAVAPAALEHFGMLDSGLRHRSRGDERRAKDPKRASLWQTGVSDHLQLT